MAALKTIARELADELREGIAWVIVWKIGRSWNAQAVWLNCDDEIFEPEDMELARKVLEQDPDAVMLNGYYCGHFGENMTVEELAAGIRWHYDNGYNQLDGSTAFPAEPEPRPESIPADMPWYGNMTNEGPDPYIYDGYISLEDLETMFRNMEVDRQQQQEGTQAVSGDFCIDEQRFNRGIRDLEISHFSFHEFRSPPATDLIFAIKPDTVSAIMDATAEKDIQRGKAGCRDGI